MVSIGQEEPFAACALFDIQSQSPYNPTALKENFQNKKAKGEFLLQFKVRELP
jgi:hypothetical protein